jgi:endonuclease G
MARRSSNDSGGFLFKTGLFAVLAAVAYWLFNLGSGAPEEAGGQPDADRIPTQTEVRPAPTVGDELLPVSTTGEVVRHTYYVVSYNEDHEQAEWVAHELSRERLDQPRVERLGSFLPDPDVRTESATPRDYSRSGFDKGHLCPAADMAFDQAAMEESFFMSNMSPQKPAFNAGIWRELEECARDWARRFGRLYVVTGPVFPTTGYEALGQIGFSKVTVPGAYYKVLLAPEQHRAIAFIMPNEVSTRPVLDYACTIDRVEELTGIDFFPQLLTGLDEELEASLDRAAWPVNKKRYQARINQWNNQ